MSRKRSPISLSLFPFLAVLICTMGVLVALLLLVVKRADQTARSRAVETMTSLQEQLEDQKNAIAEEELRLELLTSGREEVRQRVLHNRQIRSHLDNEVERLSQKAKSLALELAAFQETDQQATALESLQQALNRSRQDLEDALTLKQAILASHQTEGDTAGGAAAAVYSIVPIASTSGTNRRPIYIECKEEGLFLYPGGHALTLDDFVRPLKAGNPLDSALLAYREHWRETDGGTDAGDAYPLMVVRPSGAHWYGTVRRAMQGWADEFGYELIPEDWNVQFGDSDQALDERVQNAIRLSRIRQEALKKMGQAVALGSVAEEPASDNGPVSLEVSNQGGFRKVSGDRHSSQIAGGSGAGADPLQKLSAQYHQANGTGSVNGTGLMSTQPQGNGSSLLGQGTDRESLTLGGSGSGTGGGAGDSFPPLSGPPGSSFGSAGPGQTSGSQNAESFGMGTAGGSSMSGSSLDTPGQEDSRTVNNGNPPSPTDGNTLANRWSARPKTAETSAGGPAAGAQDSEYLPGQLHPKALANQRGENWALPSRRRNVSAYHRPLNLKVSEEAFELLPGQWNSQRTRVEITGQLEDSLDPLVDAIWRRVDQWGSLGFEGYWKPVLHVQVDYQNQEQVQRLQQLLDGSGIVVVREEKQ